MNVYRIRTRTPAPSHVQNFAVLDCKTNMWDAALFLAKSTLSLIRGHREDANGPSPARHVQQCVESSPVKISVLFSGTIHGPIDYIERISDHFLIVCRSLDVEQCLHTVMIFTLLLGEIHAYSCQLRPLAVGNRRVYSTKCHTQSLQTEREVVQSIS
jgi:hypothetical protein